MLPRFGPLRFDPIGRREIEAFRSERIETVAAKTVNHDVGILLHMLATARDFELVATVPKVRPLRIAPVEIGYDRHRARTGLRLSELRALRWKDVDLVAGLIVVAMVLRCAHLSPDAKRDAVRTLDRGHTLGTTEREIAKTGL